MCIGMNICVCTSIYIWSLLTRRSDVPGSRGLAASTSSVDVSAQVFPPSSPFFASPPLSFLLVLPPSSADRSQKVCIHVHVLLRGVSPSCAWAPNHFSL